MIDWSNTYFRQLMRILCSDVLLYTEMQTTGAIEYQPGKSLQYHDSEHPIAIQLGGADSKALAKCAIKAEQLGYDEINLNVGCPSDRVLSGQFGACLMAKPSIVAEAIKAIKKSVSIPVTVKTRIGIDQNDSYEFLNDFIVEQIEAGVDKVIVHARKAWLNGLSPKENRTIPLINYDYVYRLKQDYPHLPIVINGDIKTIEAIYQHLQQVDGVMLGRVACDNPYLIHQFGRQLFSHQKPLSRVEAFIRYLPIIEEGIRQGVPLSITFKPIMNLCHGMPGAKLWKKQLTHRIQTKTMTGLGELEQTILQLEQQDHGKMIQYLVH